MKSMGNGDEDLILTQVKSEPRVHSPCEKDMAPAGPSQSNSLFSTIANSNKRSRTDDWLSPPSPGPPMGSAPLTPSPGPHNQYAVISNGYSSPMSSGSCDPYSPNGKLGLEKDLKVLATVRGFSGLVKVLLCRNNKSPSNLTDHVIASNYVISNASVMYTMHVQELC
ncbi:hypothetical protein RUM44_002828 [Polyplax serrata]|uniref:Uncharacterized protein n=1 Tax=Polyplax serrata TaxID=468196 RepID=A0ABR1AGD9_POLSC